MKLPVFLGALLTLLGVSIIVVPQFIFPVCETTIETAFGGVLPMRCHWTGQAEIGVGALLSIGGLVICLVADPRVRLGVALMTACAALLAAAIPTEIIGVCPGRMMHCRIGTLPALLLLSGIAFAVSAFLILHLKKQRP